MKTTILIAILATVISTASFADDSPGSCEESTGLPECGTVARGVHCCVDPSSVPNVQCYRPYVAMQDNEGHWHCEFEPTVYGR